MARKKSEDKKRRLCIYLFRDTCSDFGDALKDASVLTSYSIKGFSDDVMGLYVKGSQSFLPKWLDFFDGFLKREIEENILNSSSSAVLFVKHDGRIFAFTFGYGRSFLNLNLVEDNFGLKVALNSIDTDYANSVSGDISNIPEYSNFKFLEHEGEHEGDYNKKVYDANKQKCLLMDMSSSTMEAVRIRLSFVTFLLIRKISWLCLFKPPLFSRA